MNNTVARLAEHTVSIPVPRLAGQSNIAPGANPAVFNQMANDDPTGMAFAVKAPGLTLVGIGGSFSYESRYRVLPTWRVASDLYPSSPHVAETHALPTCPLIGLGYPALGKESKP